MFSLSLTISGPSGSPELAEEVEALLHEHGGHLVSRLAGIGVKVDTATLVGSGGSVDLKVYAVPPEERDSYSGVTDAHDASLSAD